MQLFDTSGSKRTRLSFVFFILSILLVAIVYVWFVSYGKWHSWKTNTAWYDQLAVSFQHGQLSLGVKPSPALLALHNPYDPGERKPLGYSKYVGDLSLYKGKYYLYFGPAPVLIDLVLNPFVSGEIGDQYSTFIFFIGIFMLQSLLILRLRKRFFSEMPPWIVLLCIIFVGLASPAAWMLSEASAYTSAIAGGQFFFLAGLYAVFNALDRDTVANKWLIIAGILFALSLGSRLTQIFSVGWIVLLVVLFILLNNRENKSLSKLLISPVSLTLPVLVGLGLLSWYNWARFGSPFETGLYYQLSGMFIQKYYQYVFSIRYVLPNLYDYLFMRPKVVGAFPWLIPPTDYGIARFSFLEIPPLRNQGVVTGILFNTPFVIYACIPIFSWFIQKKFSKGSADIDRSAFTYKQVSVSLFGSFLFGFAPLVAFFWVETRYMEDFLPSLFLLSVLGFWQGDQAVASQIPLRRIYRIIGVVLIVASIIIGTLLAITINAHEFHVFDTGV